MLERSGIGPLAARLVTGPFAFFVSWTIDLAILLRELRRRRQRRRGERPPDDEAVAAGQ